LQVVEAVRAAGAEVAGIGLLVDRSGGQVNYGVPVVEALLELNIESFAPDAVPDWLFDKYGPPVKPGSSKPSG
jgi:orotate phosphoribosyltransferase